jgi:hypothetical protein
MVAVFHPADIPIKLYQFLVDGFQGIILGTMYSFLDFRNKMNVMFIGF